MLHSNLIVVNARNMYDTRNIVKYTAKMYSVKTYTTLSQIKDNNNALQLVKYFTYKMFKPICLIL